MKALFTFTIGLGAFLLGAFSGVWFSQHRFDDKVRDIKADYKLDSTGQAFMNLTEWQARSTNVEYSLVFQIECGVVGLMPYIEAHPQSEVATNYHMLVEDIRQYRTTKYRWYLGETNLDSSFDKILAKIGK